MRSTFGVMPFTGNGAHLRSLGKPAAAYPAAVATDSDLIIAVDREQTRLALPLNSTDTQMTVADPSMVVAYNLLSIDNEIVKTTGVPVGNVVPIQRGFDGTTAAIHLVGATVAGMIDAYHHNRLVAEIEAIEQTLGANLSGIATSPLINTADYSFTPIVSGSGVTVPGGNLVVGSNALTFAKLPVGVNGTDTDHYLWISGGTGAAEGAKITGGSGVAGQPGQLIITCANAHSGAWTVSSASDGIAEACVIASSRGGGIIFIPAGTHEMHATVRVFSYTHLIGCGIYNTVLHRTADYGDTFVMGYATTGVNCITFEDIYCYHDIGTFSPGPPPVVPNKPTKGSHALVQGGNTISFRRCRFQDLVYGVKIVGGAQIMIDDCAFNGLYSPAYTSGQVTQADVQIGNDPNLGIATYVKLRGVQCVSGYRGAAGEIWGPRYRILVNGVEDLEILGGAIAASAVNSIQLFPTAGATLANVRITAGVRFDGSSVGDINIGSDGSGQSQAVAVVGCMFNGQRLGSVDPYSQHAVEVANNGSGLNAVIGLEIAANLMFNYSGAPILINDALGFSITNNTVYMYNLHGYTDQNGGGILVGGRAGNGLIAGNLVGGDNTGTNPYGTGNNKCLYGIWLFTNNSITLCDNYPPFFGAIGTPTDMMFQAYTNRSYFLPDESAGANNALVANFPGVPLLRGLRVNMIIAHSLQAGPNTFNFNGTGPKPIRSLYNPNNNIATPYVPNGTISLQYDGAEWLDLSQ